MKLSKFVSLLVLGAIVMAASTGCRKKPVGITPIRTGSGITGTQPGDIDGTKPITDGDGSNKTDIEGKPLPAAGKFDGWSQDAEMFKQDMVFFAYDSSAVRPGEKSKVAKVADYMKANSEKGLEVDGHCDERGTEEYNRALGERRALAVRAELINLGVNADMITTKSFGKDRPIEPLHAESAYSKNRRAEFIVLTKPQ